MVGPSERSAERADGPDDLSRALLAFVGDVASAPDLEQLQGRYLDGIGRFVESSAAGVYVFENVAPGVESFAARGVSDAFLARYEAVGRHHDLVFRRVLEGGAMAASDDLMSPEDWRGSLAYREVFRLHRMDHLLQTPLVVDGRVVGTLNFGRTPEEGPFRPPERRAVEALAGLLGVTIAAMRQRQALTRERDGVRAALELVSDPLLVVDLTHGVRTVNGAARRLLELVADGPEELDRLVAAVVDWGAGRRHEREVRLQDGRAAVLDLRASPSAGPVDTAVGFLALRTLDARLDPPLHLGGLTPREQEVAALAAAGLRDREIAEQLFLSHHTVRQHLKGVYAKLGVRSRVDLARRTRD